MGLLSFFRSSVVGLFLRKMLLGYAKLQFSDIVTLYKNLEKYFLEGENFDGMLFEFCSAGSEVFEAY